jgi:hypothetical protein
VVSGPDATAARVLAGAALVALGVGLAVSGLAWTVDVYPGAVLTGFRPPAGSLTAFLATLVAAVVLFRVRELLWTDRPRQAMWTAFAGGFVAALAAYTASGDTGPSTGLHLVGPAALLVPIALGTGAALALLASSSLYEALCRDPLRPDAVGYAQARLDAVLRPPEELYYVYY